MCSEKDRDIDLASLQEWLAENPSNFEDRIHRINKPSNLILKSMEIHGKIIISTYFKQFLESFNMFQRQELIFQSNPTLEPVVKWCGCRFVF